MSVLFTTYFTVQSFAIIYYLFTTFVTLNFKLIYISFLVSSSYEKRFHATNFKCGTGIADTMLYSRALT